MNAWVVVLLVESGGALEPADRVAGALIYHFYIRQRQAAERALELRIRTLSF